MTRSASDDDERVLEVKATSELEIDDTYEARDQREKERRAALPQAEPRAARDRGGRAERSGAELAQKSS